MRAEWVPRDGVFFPAHFRCATAADLAVAEADFAAAQQTMTVRESIRTCGFPKGDAPSELPANLIAFGMMARAMQLTADSPLDDLLHHAQLASAASGVAAQLITERADASDFFLETLQSRNIARVGIALAMTREWKQLPSDTTSLILEQLSTMPLTAHREAYERIEGCERFELLLLMLSELRPVAPETPAALRVLMRRVARHDATLVGCIRAVLAVLESPVAAK